MSFININVLPFKRARINGVDKFIAYLGDTRIISENEALLIKEPIIVTDHIINTKSSYEYHVKLPGKYKLTPTVFAKEYVISTDDTKMMMGCQIIPDNADSTGVIDSILKSFKVASQETLVFKVTQALSINIGTLNYVEGVIVVDSFAGRIPSSYKHTVYSTLTDRYRRVKNEEFEFIFGLDEAHSPFDSFVTETFDEMLQISIKKGDRCFINSTGQSFINQTGENGQASDWKLLGVDDDTTDLSVVNTLINSAIAELVIHTNTIVGNPHQVTKNDVGLGNVPNTDFTAAVAANTAKIGITAQQANDILAANTHRSLTNNPHQVTKAQLGLGNVPNVDFTSDVTANNLHRSIIAGNPHRVTKAEVGLSDVPNVDLVHAVNENTIHRLTTMGNPHQVNKIEVGLGQVPNYDFTTDVNQLIQHRATISGNPHQVTKAEIGLGDVPNTDFTSQINDLNNHANTVTGNPHQVTKADVGLGNVPNVDFTADIVSANTHRATVTGNPHQVTKADVGLGNVPNVDCTNASNITTGTLPSSVLPPIAITDVFIVDNQAAQLALVVQRGDIAVRTDQGRSYINTTSNNTSMTDWQEVLTPTDTILSVNGQTGNVVLTTSDITEGVNLYYTEDRVNANTNVAANTAARHIHANQAILDTTTAAFTTEQAAAIVANTAKIGITAEQASAILANTAKVGITPEQANDIISANIHRGTIIGNPHNVTKADVGLGNVPNVDFTNEIYANTIAQHTHSNKAILDTITVAFTTAYTDAIAANTAKVGITPEQAAAIIANTAKVGITVQQAADIEAANEHRTTITGNPHQVTKADVGLGNVPNVDFTNEISANTAARHVHVNKVLLDNTTAAFTTEQASAIVANTEKVGITPEQAAAIIANTAKVGITAQQASDIVDAKLHIAIVTGNPHNVTKDDIGLGNVPNVDLTAAVAASTAIQHTHANKAILDTITVAFTEEYVTAINANTAKVGITPEQAAAIVANTAKVGITPSQATDIVTAVEHTTIVTGNPHQVTKADVGLGNVPNVDLTAAVAASTAIQHTHTNKSILDNTTATFTTEQANAIVANTAKVGITAEQAAAIVANTAKVGITSTQVADIEAANDHRATITGNPHNVTKTDVGLGNVPNVDFTDAITANTAAQHTHSNQLILNSITAAFTTEQAAAIVANTAKVGITPEQAANIVTAIDHTETTTGNPHRVTKEEIGLGDVPNVDFTTDVNANTAARHIHANKAILDTITVAFNNSYVDAITANTAKVGITPEQAAAIIANTAKVGITAQQASDITTANVHVSTTSGNPHQVTKADVGLGDVPNTDFTSDVTANTAARHTHVNKTVLDAITTPFTTEQASAIVANTAKVGITPEQAAAIVANTAKVGITVQQAADIESANDHITTVTGNPHQVTKAQVGLGNVPNVDCTNASNITTGTLPSSVLPPIAITDTYVVPNEAAQLALIVQRGDIVVRTDLNKSYINKTGDNTTVSDWQELLTPTDTVLSVNGQVGSVVLSTTNIAEGNNLYYTEDRVALNPEVVANTAARHTHVNNAILNDMTAAFTVEQAAAIVANTAKVGITPEQANAIIANTAKVGITPEQAVAIISSSTHEATVSGNPHNVTKADVGLGNVPNTDFTAEVSANTIARHVHGNKAILDAVTASFTTEQADAIVANTAKVGITPEQAAAIIANTAKVGITPEQAAAIVSSSAHEATISGNPHNVTKAEVGLGNVPNVDFTSDVNANTAARHIHANKAILDAITAAFTAEQADAIVANTAKVGITSEQAAAIVANSAKIGLTPEQINIIADSMLHIATVTGNPHQVTKADVGLSNVPNVDLTAAVAASTAAQHMHVNKTVLDETTAAFTTEQADAIVANTAKVGITSEQAAAIVANTAKVGITTAQADDIEAANTHRASTENPHAVTKAQVGLGNVPNVDFSGDVTANTAARHIHANKSILDTTTAAFTTEQANAIVANTAKVGITPEQAAAIIANSAKVGLNPQQISTITDAATHINTISGNPHQVTKAEVGLGNVPNVDLSGDVVANTAARHIHDNKTILDTTTASFTEELLNNIIVNNAKVGITTSQANAIIANTAKVGITPEQAAAIEANTAKVGITSQQASDIESAKLHIAIVTGNPHQVTKADVGLGNVPNVDLTYAVAASTAAQHTHSNKVTLDAITAAFTTEQANAIVANTAKVGITTEQADAILANTAHRNILSGNPHGVTKADIGLGNVPDVDLSNDVALNTANRHNHSNKAVLDATTASFTTAQADAIAVNSAKVGITPEQAAAIIANTAKVGITAQQASDIVDANVHRATIGNVHGVTKTDVGLGNVPNVDCTNASNITTGTLPSSVLPPIAITDTFVVNSEAAQLALSVQKGDVAVRTDLNKSFINKTGANTVISDWQELLNPTDSVLSVNGQTGSVVLSTTNIAEGSNLYYTEARVNANTNVAANTAARHTHANKTALDAVSGVNTGDQTNITGNAGTATKLATPRTINGVSFDGSANITIPVGTGDVTLNGTQTLTNKTIETAVLTKGFTEQTNTMADNIIRSVNGSILTKTLTANTVFTDSLLSGQSLTLMLLSGTSYTVTWPAITWVSQLGNVAPLLSASNVFVFWKIGTTLYGTRVGGF